MRTPAPPVFLTTAEGLRRILLLGLAWRSDHSILGRPLRRRISADGGARDQTAAGGMLAGPARRPPRPAAPTSP
jgi:hypothetical protein